MVMSKRMIELWVGVLMLAAIGAALVLAIKVSGLTNSFGRYGYRVTASFDNIGGLKLRSPITLAGVRIGQVSDIKLDNERFNAIVTMQIEQSRLPQDTSASILTEGLLGANYISLQPGYSEAFLKDGDKIQETHSALILENLLGQLLFSLKNSGEKR
jgi:phospholipid/cholesterol/gamma-HCH transport system substrate-binding protein